MRSIGMRTGPSRSQGMCGAHVTQVFLPLTSSRCLSNLQSHMQMKQSILHQRVSNHVAPQSRSIFARAGDNDSSNRPSSQGGPGESKGGKDDSKARKDSSGKGGMDWDGAWSSFQKQVSSNVDRDPQQNTRPPPKPQAGPPRRAASPPQMSQASKSVRDNERLMLDFFVNENFSRVGALAAILLMFVFFLGTGAPPMDDRCTLPWC